MSNLLNAFVAAAVEVVGELPVDITENTPIEDIGIDSLSLIEITMILEDEMDLVLNSKEFEDIETVGDSLAVFERLNAAQHGAPA